MDNSDIRIEAYNAGYKSGFEHQSPSSETREFITNTKVVMEKMKEDIESIKEKLGKIPDRNEVKLAIREGVEEALKSAEKKFATIDRVSMLEKVVYGFVGMCLTAVGGAILYQVIK